MDKEEIFKDFIHVLFEEGFITTDDKGEFQVSSISNSEGEKVMCKCMKTTAKEENTLSSGRLSNFLFHVLPNIIEIVKTVLPLFKTIKSCNVDPLILAQLLIKIIPKLREKFQVLQIMHKK
ncbi:hypothetical protein O3M35_008594 [Rhynocoris fuscipes]|uniref:Uncharacterized protein n=1 Tax=Rhynocoris fuscipes TaxID=488301 RepID=A0AAW1D9G4_9HEMI